MHLDENKNHKEKENAVLTSGQLCYYENIV